MSTSLSRSGKTNAEGKLTQRLDIPVSEELHDRVVVAAAHEGVPKAEFLRDMLEEALANGCWFPLTPQARQALNVMSALHATTPGEYLASLVNESLIDNFSMAQMMVRKPVSGQWDENRKINEVNR